MHCVISNSLQFKSIPFQKSLKELAVSHTCIWWQMLLYIYLYMYVYVYVCIYHSIINSALHGVRYLLRAVVRPLCSPPVFLWSGKFDMLRWLLSDSIWYITQLLELSGIIKKGVGVVEWLKLSLFQLFVKQLKQYRRQQPAVSHTAVDHRLWSLTAKHRKEWMKPDSKRSHPFRCGCQSPVFPMNMPALFELPKNIVPKCIAFLFLLIL